MGSPGSKDHATVVQPVSPEVARIDKDREVIVALIDAAVNILHMSTEHARVDAATDLEHTAKKFLQMQFQLKM
jgi:hypothetical protein